MGLDIYFHKTACGGYDTHRKAIENYWKGTRFGHALTTEEQDKLSEEDLRVFIEAEKRVPDFVFWKAEVGYFRKVNFLTAFFGYEDNCSNRLVREEEFEELLDRCNRVLADHGLAESLLPTESGFFFGSTDYGEWYFRDVEDVRDWCVKLLKETDWEMEEILMWCWW